jgi:hypothetical protein
MAVRPGWTIYHPDDDPHVRVKHDVLPYDREDEYPDEHSITREQWLRDQCKDTPSVTSAGSVLPRSLVATTRASGLIVVTSATHDTGKHSR